MLSLRTWKSQNRLTRGAFAIDMSFSVSSLVFSEYPEIAKTFIFTSSGDNIFRKHSEKYPYQHGGYYGIVSKIKPN